jgi:protein O-mannosyl-transferase
LIPPAARARADTKAESAATPQSRRFKTILAALLFLAACLPFLPAINAGFSDFDDTGFLLDVHDWRGLAPENIQWMFSTMHLGHYQPLTYLSYAIEYSLFGLDPRIFHATNILLHAASAVLLFFLAIRLLALALPALSPRHVPLLAAGAALIWAVHPLRVESVAWITERRDVLSAALLLGTALAYLKSARPREAALASRRWYMACILLLLASLLAKAWGITFIAIVLVLDVYPLRRLSLAPRTLLGHDDRLVLLQKLPIVVLCIIFTVVAGIAQRTASAETMKTLDEWGIAERLAQTAHGLVFYAWKTLLPTRLSALYELPDSIAWTDPKWFLSVAVVLAVITAAVALCRRLPGLVAALACYAILLLPVLGIAQSGIQLVADRYSYIASMALLLLAAAAAGLLLLKRPGTRLGLVAIAIGAGLAFSAMAWRQSSLWGDTLKLWETSLARGHDGPVVRNYYARQLEKARRPGEAIVHYKASLEMRPSYADSWFGLGNASRALGDFATAEQSFARAAQLDLDPTAAYLALGLLYIAQLDRPADALAAFQKSVAATERAGNPGRTGRPYLMLAAAHDELGDETQAIRWLREAAKWPDTREEAESILREFGPGR